MSSNVSHALCLPISVQEVLEMNQKETAGVSHLRDISTILLPLRYAFAFFVEVKFSVSS